MKMLFMKVMNKLLPSCKDVSHLTSQSMDEPLTLRKRMAMRLHIKMCIWCRRNQEQLMLMNEISSEQTKKNIKNLKLSNDAKDRISRFLDDK